MSRKNAAVAGALVAAAMLAGSMADAFVPPETMRMAPMARAAPLRAIRRGGRGRRGGGRQQKEFVPPMNDEIKQDSLRVNVAAKDGKDESLGIMSKRAALAKAQELGGLDLILINANSDPPVCKIVDYSKYRYQQEKKRKEKAKNSKATEIKEVKMSYKIGDHDYGVRLRSAAKFIRQGNRVKTTVMFRGREVQHDKLGVDLLERLAGDLEEICVMEGRPRREGRNLGAILSPRAEVVKAINDAKRTKEKEKKRARAESLARRTEAIEAKKDAARAAVEEALGGVDLDDFDMSTREGIPDEDIDDDDLDQLLGPSKVADDLFA